MLTQTEVDRLIQMKKTFARTAEIDFPAAGGRATYEVVSVDTRDQFEIDINRGLIRLTKCTFQERYRVTEILVRVDLDGPPHENPDGQIMPCPHVHIYREGYGDKWAEPLPGNRFSNPSNLINSFRDFLGYCNVTNVPSIQGNIL